ncbi:hypothetical protein CF54_09550 [Streptomyces sp. Tu 6176]|nr:hypothetical protein CF54_09550 [Streptomyces sp. Tu 6176]
MLDQAVLDDQGEPLVQRQPAGGEGGQTQCPAQAPCGVGQHPERQTEPLGDLALVVAVLTGEAVHPGRARREQVLVVVTEAACLDGAATGAGDGVPALGQIGAGAARQRVDVEHRAPRPQRVEADGGAVGGTEFQPGHPRPAQMGGSAVVLGNGQSGRQARVVGHRFLSFGR